MSTSKHRRRFRNAVAAISGLCLSLAWVSLCHAVEIVDPASEGISAERLERIATAVQGAIDGGRIAGAVTLISRHGHIVWLRAQGMSDREAGLPLKVDDLFRIGSMTKPITTVGALMLYEDGKFLLEDPISKYLPEFTHERVRVTKRNGQVQLVPAKKAITILDLLRQTSGLTYHWNPILGETYRRANVAHGIAPYQGSLAESVRRLATVPLLFEPGSNWEYGLNTDVLGRLIEVVSGQPLDRYLHDRLFTRLGMNDTNFVLPKVDLPRLAIPYTFYPDRGLQRFPDKPIVEKAFEYSADFPYPLATKYISGGAGLVSSATDYWRFAQMLLDKGSSNGMRILSRKSVELMTSDQIAPLSADEGEAFGFGFGLGIDGLRGPLREAGSVGTFWWGGFFYTWFYVDPREQLITELMVQLHPYEGLELHREVKALAYQALDD